ncbi:Uncharacterised protein [Chlamydia trachomatis]|nr:Uncharacterised protein [Chlamydia trachomatis]
MKKPGRRVISLSRVDRERLERGEISLPEEAFKQYDAPAVAPQGHSYGSDVKPLSLFEKDILENIPPHFGKI